MNKCLLEVFYHLGKKVLVCDFA